MSISSTQAASGLRPTVKHDPLTYISASRLKTWSECRLKWYFRYVEKIPTQVTPPLFIGQVTHAVLQQWNLRRWRGLRSDETALHPVFLDLW